MIEISHTHLDHISTLDDFEAFVASEPFETYLGTINGMEEAAEEVAALRASIARARGRLAPEATHAELVELKAQVLSQMKGERATLEPLLERIATIREALPTHRHERIFDRLETRIGQRFVWTNSGVGYSNRARRASYLFTEFAGQTHIAGAETDKHGNAQGTGYDLGRDGAFEGFTVHVLQLYLACNLDKPCQAFERKGFAFEHRKAPGTPDELEAWLEDAAQLWIVSDSTRKLSEAHIEVIRAFWARGGALYIWGDNLPFYADANAITEALFGPELKLDGNLHGDQVVGEYDDGKGFHPHLITTGLAHLYEGITIASVEPEVAERYGFEPLLWGSAGNLVAVVRDASAEGGPVMIDGGFTRLYCQWDEAGTARYVCNAACFLGVPMVAEPEDEDEDEDEDAAPALPFEPEGAFVGTCDLSGKGSERWMVLSVTELADPLINTSDRVLTDPLCAGDQNMVFSDAVYSETMGQWLLGLPAGKRVDPVTGEPVVACLPVVDLSHARNLRGFTQILCACLMDNKYIPTAARMIFFAVIDEMLAREELAHRDAWEYLYRQALRHFPSTASFTAIGAKMPLLDAMAELFSPATEDKAQIRRSFESISLIGRTLLREDRASTEHIRCIARRARVKYVVRDALAAEKAQPGAVPLELNGLLYDNFHGVPRLLGGRIAADDPSFVRDVSHIESRITSALDSEDALLSREEHTIVLQALLAYDLRQLTVESALTRMYADDAAFAAVYDDEPVEGVVDTLNAKFEAYVGDIDLEDVHLRSVIPFVTTSGPSVFECVCGHTFLDVETALTDESIDQLRAARVAHFREVYHVTSPGQTWYPSHGSLHCNMHRAVQSVMREQFEHATAFEDRMLPALAHYLLRDGKGFIYDPRLEQRLRGAAESYLSLRALGQDHPRSLMTLEVKARLEQEARLGARQIRKRVA